ncbi:MAG TPA: MetS family NSS transporter small subunit [Clostridiaceae bacterium]|nr:MetS family NSS transporter small subunit [Clostridiaceae bacterium]
MSAGAIIMMVIGLGTVWGGALITILIALATDKKNKLKHESSK